MSEQPLVSIIIPVFNGSDYLDSAINSALNQTYPNIEVIVVNDGSTDDGETEKVALSYGERIRYICKENGGVATAVNVGIRAMAGEYFAWLSHDDYYYPFKIEKQMEAIKRTGDCMAICHSNFDFVHVGSAYIEHVDWLNCYSTERMQMGAFAPTFLSIHGGSVLFHKDHFTRVGLYDEKLITTQDTTFLFNLMKGQKIVFVNESLFASRIHALQGSKTISCHKKEWNEMLIYFCENLSEQDKKLFCGSVFNFYYRMRVMVNDNEKAEEIVPYLEKKLKLYFSKSVCIFGAGVYGKRLLYDLKQRNVKVTAFIDNDINKRNKTVVGVPCVLPRDISEEEKCTTTVIMGLLNDQPVIRELKGIGFKRIISYHEISKRLFDSPIEPVYLE